MATLNFDEDWYLTNHPDVAAAVQSGDLLTGLQHFEAYGRAEGRQPCAPECELLPPAPVPVKSPLRPYRASELDAFVATVDAAGGLGAPEAQLILANFTLAFDTLVDLTLDPYSEAYVACQIALYEEVSGRRLDQSLNELTQFNLDDYAAAANPYSWRDPSALVVHHLRIGTAIKHAALKPEPTILDLGAGWGLTSEFMAMLGGDVVAIDINPDFVTLINRRATRLGLPLRALAGTFDDFSVPERFDLAFFYEALHHAVRPWDVIARCGRHLKVDGRIAFAAEPIQEAWWPAWGLRLDAVSVYCIRKFGWFESGWSHTFVTDMFRRVDLALELWPDAEGRGGSTGVARPCIETLSGDALCAQWLGFGWSSDRDEFCSCGAAEIRIPDNAYPIQLGLDVINYRAQPLDIRVRNEAGVERYAGSIPIGPAQIAIPVEPGDRCLTLHSDAWVPAEEYDTPDRRTISFNFSKLHVRCALSPST
ncbi:methyltransferase domain-containing protein [Methylobacterium sp. WL12]|uniref:class I SAM-dependent methyltransferase n=1 Tax=Methylobacterium sp. WL12 TaxID=2603890 RepID=UPI0011C9E69D|nr:class I SAM-dependent methyltransferase [Methylobacterium sp. WL12]TXM67547.1 methyltransferase domain-containing protein [Methylobacterium sp. WL12]